MKRFAILLLIGLGLFCLSCGDEEEQAQPQPPAPRPAPDPLASLKSLGEVRKDPNREWTILAYMDGDNDLEAELLEDLNTIEKAMPADGLEVIALLDRARGYSDADGDWTETRVYRARADADLKKINSELLSNCGELNLGDPKVLATFLAAAMQTYPARRYALFLSDHGSGWPDCANDFDAPGARGGGDELTLSELQSALKDALAAAGKSKFDLLVFDMCLMGQLEVAVACKDVADVVVFSEGVVPGEGLPYEDLLGDFHAGRLTNPQMARRIVNVYGDHYKKKGRRGVTLSAVDCARVGDVVAALDALAKALMPAADRHWPNFARSVFYAECYAGRTDYRKGRNACSSVDLIDTVKRMRANIKDFPADREVDEFLQAARSCILASRAGPQRRLSNGLAIYAPLREENLKPSYADEALARASSWPAFLQKTHHALAQHLRAPTISAVKVIGPDGKATGAIKPMLGNFCTFTVEGTNLLWINFAMGSRDGEKINVSFRTFHMAPGMERRRKETAAELADLIFPVYKDGKNELAQELGGIMMKVVSGDTSVPATVCQTDPGDIGHVVVRGLYSHAALGTDVPVDIWFDTSWWTVDSVTAYIKRPDGGTIRRQITPKSDAKIKLFTEVLAPDGSVTRRAGDAVVWGKGPELIMALAPPGDAAMLLEAECIGGRSATHTVKFKVQANEVLERYLKSGDTVTAKLLQGRWQFQVLQVNPYTGVPQYQPMDVKVTFRPHPRSTAMLLYEVATSGGTTKGSAHLEKRGLPILSIYGTDEDGREVRMEAYLPILERVMGHTTIILKDLMASGIYRLVKVGEVGDVAPRAAVGRGGDPKALVGTWEAPEGEIIKISANGRYTLYRGEEIIDQGTYKVEGNKMTLTSADGEVDVCTFTVTDKKLTLIDEDGEGTTLTRVK